MKSTGFRLLSGKSLYIIMCLVALSVVASSCNMDDELSAVAKPVIEFDHADGIYSVVCGEELTLAPKVENGKGAEYVWTLDDEVIGREPQLTRRWTVAGEFYLLLTVRNAGGVDREEVRVDVAALLPPAISLTIADDRLTLQKETSYSFRPLIGNLQKGETAEVKWFVDGVEKATGDEYTFEATDLGSFEVEIVVTGIGGEARRRVTVEVVEQLPATISFVPLSLGYDAAVRYTIVGRPVALQLVTENVGDKIEWSVNGEKTETAGDCFIFTPQQAGNYQVTASVAGAIAEMKVVVASSAAASAGATAGATVKVLEWMPAPGQFIGETSSVGGMTDDILTHDQACRWAEQRLAANHFVSLGAWGGYLVMALDGSISNSGAGYDFAIMGNAIPTSNEPGIVRVMQDVNGNGLPDDEWYELRGSDFDGAGVDRNYRATYYRPAGSGMAVQWNDSRGASGVIDYIGGTHSQPSYYPAWFASNIYTIYGCRLPARNSQNPVTGFWTNEPFAWGYVDNLGSDLLQGGDTESGMGQWVGFKISNAVLPNGTPVSLSHIDFIMVQTAVMAGSGRLGELSTEVAGLKIISD